MERSLFRYIFKHTWRNQVLLLIVTAISFPLIYVNLAIPKEIVNNAITGTPIPKTDARASRSTHVSYLMMLSFLLLALITLNGVIKYWLNVYSGVIGERALRRLRHDLYQQVLRFPLPQFKTMSSGEIIPMVVAETDPIGGFIGESISLPAFQGGLLLTYMVFIFMQDFWLGLAAIALYPPQVWLIPKLQKKINQLVEAASAAGARAVRPHRRNGRRRRRDPRQRHVPARARRHQRPAGQDLRDPLRHLQAQVLRQVPEQLSSRRSRRSSSTRSAATS